MKKKLDDKLKTINPKTGKFWKHGDVRDDGYVFKNFDNIIVKRTGKYLLHFYNKDAHQKGLKATTRNSQKRTIRTQNNSYEKRINKKFNTPYKVGDEENGLYFSQYKANVETTKQRQEVWKSYKDLEKSLLVKSIKNCKNTAKKHNLMFDIDYKYLLSIIPEDYICPLSNRKMNWWSRDWANVPTIDRVVPSLGYVKGNIKIICKEWNTRKRSFTLKELDIFITFYENLLEKLKNGFHMVNKDTNYALNEDADFRKLSPADKKVINYYLNYLVYDQQKRAIRDNRVYKIHGANDKDKNYFYHLIPKDWMCPLLGIKLEFGKKDGLINSPSFDRIDNSKGYVKNNIICISNQANTLKSNNNLDDLKKIRKYILNNI